MKRTMPKSQAIEKINSLFSQKTFTSEQARKTRRIALKYRISLKDHRKKFCKKCYTQLKNIKVRVTKTHKTVECPNTRCKHKSRWKIKPS